MSKQEYIRCKECGGVHPLEQDDSPWDIVCCFGARGGAAIGFYPKNKGESSPERWARWRKQGLRFVKQERGNTQNEF